MGRDDRGNWQVIEDELPTPRNLVLIAVLFEGGLGVVAVVFGWLLGYPPLEQVEWAGDALAWGAAAFLNRGKSASAT